MSDDEKTPKTEDDGKSAAVAAQEEPLPDAPKDQPPDKPDPILDAESPAHAMAALKAWVRAELHLALRGHSEETRIKQNP
jgi:hypothetical protein